MHADITAVRDGNAGGFLAAVLQSEQTKEGHAGHVFMGGKYPDHPAFFLGMFVFYQSI